MTKEEYRAKMTEVCEKHATETNRRRKLYEENSTRRKDPYQKYMQPTTIGFH